MRSDFFDTCDFAGCGKPLKQKVVHIKEIDGRQYSLCPDCLPKVVDRTGSCSAECQLGHGCDCYG